MDTMRIDKKAGANIKAVRTHFNLTQEWVAEKVGVQVRTIQRAEAGQVTEKLMDELATALSVPVAIFTMDWQRTLDDLRENYVSVELPMVTSGKQLGSLLNTAHFGLMFSASDFGDKERDDLAVQVNDEIMDYVDIWSSLGPADRSKAAGYIDKMLETLATKRMVMTAGVDQPHIMGMDRPMPTLCVALAEEGDPRKVMWRPRGPVRPS